MVGGGVMCYVLFCFVLFCFVLFCFVLFCFVLFCFGLCVCLTFQSRLFFITVLISIFVSDICSFS